MVLLENMVISGKVTIVVRRPDGTIRSIRETRKNMKVAGTMNLIASMMCNDAAQAATCNKFGMGSGPDVVSADTALSGEKTSRTIGRFSHDAGAAQWNLSFSLTEWTESNSLYQAAIFNTLTGATMYLKATFLQMTVMSQDVLNCSWLQSISSV